MSRRSARNSSVSPIVDDTEMSDHKTKTGGVSTRPSASQSAVAADTHMDPLNPVHPALYSPLQRSFHTLIERAKVYLQIRDALMALPIMPTSAVHDPSFSLGQNLIHRAVRMSRYRFLWMNLPFLLRYAFLRAPSWERLSWSPVDARLARRVERVLPEQQTFDAMYDTRVFHDAYVQQMEVGPERMDYIVPDCLRETSEFADTEEMRERLCRTLIVAVSCVLSTFINPPSTQTASASALAQYAPCGHIETRRVIRCAVHHTCDKSSCQAIEVIKVCKSMTLVIQVLERMTKNIRLSRAVRIWIRDCINSTENLRLPMCGVSRLLTEYQGKESYGALLLRCVHACKSLETIGAYRARRELAEGVAYHMVETNTISPQLLVDLPCLRSCLRRHLEVHIAFARRQMRPLLMEPPRDTLAGAIAGSSSSDGTFDRDTPMHRPHEEAKRCVRKNRVFLVHRSSVRIVRYRTPRDHNKLYQATFSRRNDHTDGVQTQRIVVNETWVDTYWSGPNKRAWFVFLRQGLMLTPYGEWGSNLERRRQVESELGMVYGRTVPRRFRIPGRNPAILYSAGPLIPHAEFLQLLELPATTFDAQLTVSETGAALAYGQPVDSLLSTVLVRANKSNRKLFRAVRAEDAKEPQARAERVARRKAELETAHPFGPDPQNFRIAHFEPLFPNDWSRIHQSLWTRVHCTHLQCEHDVPPIWCSVLDIATVAVLAPLYHELCAKPLPNASSISFCPDDLDDRTQLVNVLITHVFGYADKAATTYTTSKKLHDKIVVPMYVRKHVDRPETKQSITVFRPEFLPCLTEIPSDTELAEWRREGRATNEADDGAPGGRSANSGVASCWQTERWFLLLLSLLHQQTERVQSHVLRTLLWNKSDISVTYSYPSRKHDIRNLHDFVGRRSARSLWNTWTERCTSDDAARYNMEDHVLASDKDQFARIARTARQTFRACAFIAGPVRLCGPIGSPNSNGNMLERILSMNTPKEYDICGKLVALLSFTGAVLHMSMYRHHSMLPILLYQDHRVPPNLRRLFWHAASLRGELMSAVHPVVPEEMRNNLEMMLECKDGLRSVDDILGHVSPGYRVILAPIGGNDAPEPVSQSSSRTALADSDAAFAMSTATASVRERVDVNISLPIVMTSDEPKDVQIEYDRTTRKLSMRCMVGYAGVAWTVRPFECQHPQMLVTLTHRVPHENVSFEIVDEPAIGKSILEEVLRARFEALRRKALLAMSLDGSGYELSPECNIDILSELDASALLEGTLSFNISKVVTRLYLFGMLISLAMEKGVYLPFPLSHDMWTLIWNFKSHKTLSGIETQVFSRRNLHVRQLTEPYSNSELVEFLSLSTLDVVRLTLTAASQGLQNDEEKRNNILLQHMFPNHIAMKKFVDGISFTSSAVRPVSDRKAIETMNEVFGTVIANGAEDGVITADAFREVFKTRIEYADGKFLEYIESLTTEQRHKIVEFICGEPRLPKLYRDEPPITAEWREAPFTEPALPRGHNCVNVISIPVRSIITVTVEEIRAACDVIFEFETVFGHL